MATSCSHMSNCAALILTCFLVLACGRPSVEVAASETERRVLLEAADVLADNPNSQLRTWSGTDAGSHCLWEGVQCDAETGLVYELDVSGKELTGRIPPVLSSLRAMEYLYIQGNGLEGCIPPELGAMSSLQVLMARGNQLSGSIPAEISGMSSLQYLDLADNHLSGAIPPSLGAMEALEYMGLENNTLSGAIPSELGLLDNLYDMYLQNNQLTGSIPEAFSSLKYLLNLYLNDNQLTGSIPLELSTLALEELCVPPPCSASSLWMRKPPQCSSPLDLCGNPRFRDSITGHSKRFVLDGVEWRKM